MSVEDTVAKCAFQVANAKYGRAATLNDRWLAEQHLSALKPGDLLPGGNVVVPLEPTAEMIATVAAGSEMPGVRLIIDGIYRAMLAAAGENDAAV